MLNYAVLGLGQRGKFYCASFNKIADVNLISVCDKNQNMLDYACNQYHITKEMCFLSDDEFFNQGKIADLLIISTLDKDHYRHAVKALKTGYDIVLEKPIAQTEEECLEIARLAKELNKKVFICHVLRYAPIFYETKKMLDSGDYGNIITITQTENVAYWHQAHSYVRGNWSIIEESTPMIIAKCCHDLDLIAWFIGTKCKTVSSFGALTYYKSENAPKNSSDYCYKCSLQDTCEYNCLKFYESGNLWTYATSRYNGLQADKEAILKCFSDESNPYARCVFHCDNTAVDHQVVNMQFENDVTAQLTMTAFSQFSNRIAKIHCTKGDIGINMLKNEIEFNVFGKCGDIKKISVEDTFEGHGGGDFRMVKDIVANIRGDKISYGLTSIEKSVMSHCMGFAAHESMTEGGKLIKVKEC